MEIRVDLTNRNGFETGRCLVADVEIVGDAFIEQPLNENEYITPVSPIEVQINDCWIEGGGRFKFIKPVGRARELIEEMALRTI